MTISIIVAVAENGVIGNSNEIPWYIPEDFKYFKEKTMGKPCIMGRKTYESILAKLGKALPGRTSIVISRSGYTHEACLSASSLSEAIDLAQKESPDEIFIIGGAQIYQQALDESLIDTIYLTRVHQYPDGDAFFPELSDEWAETSRDDRDGFSFLIYKRDAISA